MTPGELRTRRIHLGLSRTELAREMGIDAQTVEAWELGEVKIDSPHLLDSALRTLSTRVVRAQMDARP